MNILEPLVRNPSEIYFLEFQEQMEDWGIEEPDFNIRGKFGVEWFYITDKGAGIYVMYENYGIYLSRNKIFGRGSFDKRWYISENRDKRMLAYCNIVKYLKGEKDL